MARGGRRRRGSSPARARRPAGRTIPWRSWRPSPATSTTAQGSWTISLPRVGARGAERVRDSARPSQANGSAPCRPDRWHVRAYSVVERDGRPSSLAGLEPTATIVGSRPAPRGHRLLYLLKTALAARPSLVGRPAHRAAGSEIPPMVLVANSAGDSPLGRRRRRSSPGFPARRTARAHPIRTAVQPRPLRRPCLPRPDRRAGSSLLPIRIRHPETGPTRA